MGAPATAAGTTAAYAAEAPAAGARARLAASVASAKAAAAGACWLRITRKKKLQIKRYNSRTRCDNNAQERSQNSLFYPQECNANV